MHRWLVQKEDWVLLELVLVFLIMCIGLLSLLILWIQYIILLYVAFTLMHIYYFIGGNVLDQNENWIYSISLYIKVYLWIIPASGPHNNHPSTTIVLRVKCTKISTDFGRAYVSNIITMCNQNMAVHIIIQISSSVKVWLCFVHVNRTSEQW